MPMRRLLLAGTAVVLAVVILIVLWPRNGRHPPTHSASPRPDIATGDANPRPGGKAVSGQTSASTPLSSPTLPPRSELLDGLNDPAGSISADLKLINEVFNAWLTNFPTAGIPIGNNQEITAALIGNNSLQFAFIPPDHPAINAQGELCDRWKTPFRFHVLGRQQMEIRSAGPDRKFGTADDAEWAPWPRNF